MRTESIEMTVETKTVETKTEAKSKKSSDADIITTTDRNAFAKMIERRRETILKMLTDEIGGDNEHLHEMIRQKAGLTIGSDDIRNLLRETDKQIEETTERYTKAEKSRIDVTKAEITDQYNEKVTEAKDRHRIEIENLMKRREEDLKKLQEEFKSIKDRVMRENVSDLIDKREELSKQLLTVQQKEEEVKVELRQRTNFIQHSKGRLSHVIGDAANRALEEVWTVKTRGEATELLGKIPTVDEAFEMLQSPESLKTLFLRLCPNYAKNMMQLPCSDMEEVKKANVVNVIEEESHEIR